MPHTSLDLAKLALASLGLRSLGLRSLGLGALALVSLGLIACGGSQTLAPIARPHLGVQSNAPSVGLIALRVRPPRGMQQQIRMEAHGDASFLGRPMHLDYVREATREVIEQRPDGTTVLATRTTGGHMQMAMGDRPARDEPLEAEPAARTSVLDPRGRTIDDAMFAGAAPPTASTALTRLVFTPLLDALAYPDESLEPGGRWGANASVPIAEGDVRGTVRYELTQELVRVEGAGEGAIAVIAFRGQIGAQGTIEAGPVSGELRVRGAYTVGVADGLVRGMEASVEGQVSFGPEPGVPTFEVPFEGALRYRAQ